VSLEVHTISSLDGGLSNLVIFEFNKGIAILHHDIENGAVFCVQVSNVAIIDIPANASNVNLDWGCLFFKISVVS
jgi:hypothetical protein